MLINVTENPTMLYNILRSWKSIFDLALLCFFLVSFLYKYTELSQ